MATTPASLKKKCVALRCTERCRLPFCPGHWRALRDDLRRWIVKAHREEQPSEHARAVRAAVNYLDFKERGLL